MEEAKIKLVINIKPQILVNRFTEKNKNKNNN